MQITKEAISGNALRTHVLGAPRLFAGISRSLLESAEASPSDRISPIASKGSDEYIPAVLLKFYPGLWRAYDVGQIENRSPEAL